MLSPLGPCCDISQREDVGLHWGRIATLANDVSTRSVWPLTSANGRPESPWPWGAKINTIRQKVFINPTTTLQRWCLPIGLKGSTDRHWPHWRISLLPKCGLSAQRPPHNGGVKRSG